MKILSKKETIASCEESKSDFIKYENPKILCVDMNNNFISRMKKDGYDIEEGSFGQSYNINHGEECGFNGCLPHLTEKDILIVDLDESHKLKGENPIQIGEQWKKADTITYCVPSPQDYFNPCYLYSKVFSNEIYKIILNGGIIIIFADTINEETYYQIDIRNGTRYQDQKIKVNNYEWIPINVSPGYCISGNQVFTDNTFELLGKTFSEIINDNYKEIEYKCKFNINDFGKTKIRTKLFSNNLDEVVGYIEAIENTDNAGYLIILPQFKDKYKPIRKMFTDFLPALKPNLFPQFVRNNWVNYDEYIIPDIKKIENRKKEVVKEYEKRLNEIDILIDETKRRYNFLTNTLLSQGYDDFLVENIFETLKYIGYKNIIKVDEQIQGNRQEDLRILDDNRVTIVEIKGHNGNPTEDDCQAVLKYMNRAMKKEKRTDIHGVLIVNHNKILPPLKRKNPAFTKQQIEDSKRDEYTLISTWELYKSVRLFQEGLLSFEEIDKEIHTSGLFKSIPSSWKSLGKIEHLFKDDTIACFYLNVDKISKDDEIIIQDNNCYYKQDVKEMMINNVVVNTASKGDAVSIKINQPISKQANIFIK